MAAELAHHLGNQKHSVEGRGSGNSRSGTTRKTLQSEFGGMELEIPRDRNCSFEPQLIGKHERRFTGLDEEIISMYARGISTREIEAHLREMHGIDVSPTLVSEVADESRKWQSQSLEPIYGIVCMDALMVKTRYEGRVGNRAVYTAIGATWTGARRSWDCG